MMKVSLFSCSECPFFSCPDCVSECRNCDRPKEMDMACKTCKYWQYEEIDQGHVCVNDDSYYLAEWTDKDNYCERWTPVANEK